MYRPSDTACNGAAAVSLAVVDKNGSRSAGSSSSGWAASVRLPRFTTGITAEAVVCGAESTSSPGNGSSAGSAFQYAASSGPREPCA